MHSVQVRVQADWGGDPVRAENVSFSVIVEADATKQEVEGLIRHTDRIAEIPNSLRLGTDVKLAQATAVSRSSKTATT